VCTVCIVGLQFGYEDGYPMSDMMYGWALYDVKTDEEPVDVVTEQVVQPKHGMCQNNITAEA